MKIGVLTGGGDCPGLNAAIRAVVARALYYGWTVYGFERGWAGPIGGDARLLNWKDVEGIVGQGGTILGSSRTNPYKDGGSGTQAVVRGMQEVGVDAIVAIGGDDTLSVAAKLADEGVPCVGIPKTIDNDVWGTDRTIGFDTAVNIAVDAIDRLHTTASSHGRCMLVEVMGREAGWVALEAGLAAGAHAILIPEVSVDIKKLAEYAKERKAAGLYTIVVVSEGIRPDGKVVTQDSSIDEFGHPRLGGVANYLAQQIETSVSIKPTVTVLGHVQRGGSPTAFDRVLGTRFGSYAVDLLHDHLYARMTALKGWGISTIPLREVASRRKIVDPLFLNQVSPLYWCTL